LNLLIQFFACAFLRALLDQFALNRHLQDRFLHIVRETPVKVLKLAPRLFIAVNVWQQFFDFCNNALLLGERWNRNYCTI